MSKLKRLAASVSSAAVVVGLSFAGAIPAEAVSADEDSTRVVTPLIVAGYDVAVANANGYKIVTDDDGSWQSVAVTDAAKRADAAAARKSGMVSPNAKVTIAGPCGTSFIDVKKSSSAWRVDTGYSVAKPGNRSRWQVQVASLGGLPLITWPDGPSPATWAGAATFSTGPFGGQAFVKTSSAIIQIDGKVCTSGGPATGY